jgi:hypothetical protein
MDKYPPVYLMLVALDLKRKDIVEINIRLSDAPNRLRKQTLYRWMLSRESSSPFSSSLMTKFNG